MNRRVWGRNSERNFHKEKRSNETHASTTDPDARLYRKADGRESRLCFIGHVLMENRNGLAVDAALTCATGTAEREAAVAMVDRRKRHGRITLGADKAYDVTEFVEDLREREVTPHIAIDGRVSKHGVVRKTAVDGRTTRHSGYGISQIFRKRIEEIFGWIKTQAGLVQVKVTRVCQGRERLHIRSHGLQSDPHTQIAGASHWVRTRVSAPFAYRIRESPCTEP